MSQSQHAVIREYVGNSLKVLARVVDADLKDFPENYRMRYNGKDIDRENPGQMENLLTSPENPIQIYKPVQNEFPIEVCTGSKTCKIIVTSDDIIKLVKKKVSQKFPSYPPESQDLSMQRLSDSKLSDLHSLKRCGITGPGVKLYVSRSSLVEMKKMLKLESREIVNPNQTFPTIPCAVDKTPDWRHFGKGVNFVYACESPDCPSNAYREIKIIERKGYGTMKIDFHEIRSGQAQDQFNCPACPGSEAANLIEIEQESPSRIGIVPKGLLFREVRALVYFKTENGVTKEFIVNDNKKCEYTYKEIPPNAEVLEIHAVEPWKSPLCCVRCDAKILYECYELKPMLGCGHAYHKWCKPTGCKICDAKVFFVGKTSELVKLV